MREGMMEGIIERLNDVIEEPETRLSTPLILIVDDDSDDRFLAETAFEEIGFHGELKFVEDGEELMSYLLRSGIHYDPTCSQLPAVILMDLNMPRKNGWETLRELKNLPDLQYIPVVVWTTSGKHEDKIRSHRMGAEMFLTKPSSYSELSESPRNLIDKYCSSSGDTYSTNEN